MSEYTFTEVPQDSVVSVRYGETFLGLLRRNGGYPNSPVWADDSLSHWLGMAFTFNGPMKEATYEVEMRLKRRFPDGPEAPPSDPLEE